MSRYKVIVRNSPNWRQHKAATLGVSVPSPNWQDEKFASIMDFCAAHFEIIRIDVTDALYRHNFMAEGLPPEQALAQANAMGALWLAQHQDIIDTCPVKTQIVRWAEWYKHPDYQNVLAGFQRAHETNHVLREAVHNDAMEFYRRRQQEPSLLELEKSKAFMVEEMAVITLQARELPSVKIYPGEELKCLHVVRHGLVPEAPTGLEREQFAKIKFEKKGHMPTLPVMGEPGTQRQNAVAVFQP
jgi:tRNA-dependent cyclodipeptide synthase